MKPISYYNDFHKDYLTFLRDALEMDTMGKKIVIICHVPTFKNYPAEYKRDYLNEAFATILDNMIFDTILQRIHPVIRSVVF